MVITVGDIKDRYWSVQVVDNYSRWWLLIGSQFNAPGPVRRLLIGPYWSGKYPPDFVGAEFVQSPSNMACVAARVALTEDTPDELMAVNSVQDHVTIMSLSQWLAAGRKDIKAEDVPLTKAAYPAYPGMEAVREPGKPSPSKQTVTRRSRHSPGSSGLASGRRDRARYVTGADFLASTCSC